MVIGIGGVSNSGKSWLARKIKDNLNDQDVIILCQDNYVYPKAEIPLIRDHINWEIPESIDFNRLEKDIIQNKTNHELVIVEGLMVFYDENIRGLFDKKIFIEISKDLFLKRKAEDIRWGSEQDWYIQHIWDSYLKYGAMSKKDNSCLLLSAENINIEKTMGYIAISK